MKKSEPVLRSIQNTPLMFVFNSPTLVPWKVVEQFQKGLLSSDDKIRDKALAEVTEKILLWQETYREANRFRENDSVCEMNNPSLKMTIRRILREKDKSGEKNERGEFKQRLIGFECYWWASQEDAYLHIQQMALRAERRVPVTKEQEKDL